MIGSLISGLAGLFGGGKQQTTNTNQTTNQSGTQTGQFSNQGNTSGSYNQFGSSTPNLSPFQQQLAQMFTGGAENLYNQSQNMGGYTSGGLQQINQNTNNASKQINASLASRGLAFSPMAGTANTQNILSGTQQQNQFMQGIPLLQRQLQQQSLQQLMQAFQTQPYGTTTTGGGSQTGTSSQTGNQNVSTSGTSNTTGTGSVYGNPLGGLFGGLGAGLMAGMPSLNSLFSGFGGGGGGVSNGLNLPGYNPASALTGLL